MRMIWFVAVFLLPTCVYGQTARPGSMEMLQSLLKSGVIAKIEILRMPDEVMTRTSVTPTFLRSDASYTVTFKNELERTFGPLLSEMTPKRSSKNSDLRWGILFYNGSGQEIDSVFVDKFGEKGYMNGETVEFGSNLAKRLRQIIRELH